MTVSRALPKPGAPIVRIGKPKFARFNVAAGPGPVAKFPPNDFGVYDMAGNVSEWTADQIRSFQDYFDALMSGNLARRRMVKFMPAEFKLSETRQPPLKDQYDEWLAKLICYAFSVPASPFSSRPPQREQ